MKKDPVKLRNSVLTIKNKHEITENAALIPLIEQIALCASSGTPIRRISAEPKVSAPREGWIVFQNRESQGFGINLTECAPSATHLRRRLLQVTQAQKLARCFGGTEALPLFWTTADDCPDAWRVFRAEARMGSFLCATSFPPPAVAFQGIHVRRSVPKVSFRLVAHVSTASKLESGTSIVVPSLCVEFIGQKLWGKLSISEGGIMRVEHAESPEIPSESDDRVVIRIDVGEIEVSLDQFMAIRAGGVIELETTTPTRCFMRVGNTTLAEGELSVEEGGISIKVTDLHS